MSKALEALLSRELNEQKSVYITSLGAEVTLRSVSNDDIQEARAQASTKRGRGKKEKETVNEQQFGALLIVKGCVDPNFADKQLLDHYGVSSAEEVVTKALKPGEIAKISAEILELAGFVEDEDEAVEKVKN